jgi:PAS domain S-box-containing protein
MTSDVPESARDDLVRHSVDVITVLDDEGVIRYESPSFARTFGHDPAEFVGERVFDHVHPDDRQRVREAFDALVDADAADVTRSVEFRFRHADEGWLWVESRGAGGEATTAGGYVVTTRDISERKAYEHELERERDRLERFAGIVSHDLRSPLNVADGRLELARAECNSEHLDAVARAHDRMASMIDDLLTLAREGATTPQLTSVDLPALVEDAWRNVETKDATLAVETDHHVVADEGQLRQLVSNLVRNAVDHGGADVTVVVGPLDDGFYVADDGPGLPDRDSEELLEYGVSTAASGTGLGLNIVHEVAVNHGWELTLTQADDGGARFEIRGVPLLSRTEDRA